MLTAWNDQKNGLTYPELWQEIVRLRNELGVHSSEWALACENIYQRYAQDVHTFINNVKQCQSLDEVIVELDNFSQKVSQLNERGQETFIAPQAYVSSANTFHDRAVDAQQLINQTMEEIN